jgi:hypothetical protein
MAGGDGVGEARRGREGRDKGKPRPGARAIKENGKRRVCSFGRAHTHGKATMRTRGSSGPTDSGSDTPCAAIGPGESGGA